MTVDSGLTEEYGRAPSIYEEKEGKGATVMTVLGIHLLQIRKNKL